MRWLSKKRSFVILLTPTLLLFTVFVIIPIGIACYYSFTNFTGIGAPEYLGLANYRTLFHDKIFFQALKNTGIVLGISAGMDWRADLNPLFRGLCVSVEGSGLQRYDFYRRI